MQLYGSEVNVTNSDTALSFTKRSHRYLKGSPMPPARLLRLVVCWMFFHSSAEICVGSLVFGCSFNVTCFTIHSDCGRRCCQFGCSKRVIWHVRCVHFGTLGTIERSRGTLEHNKGDLGVQA